MIAVCIKKNLPKLLNFCIAILLLKMEEIMQHFQHIMVYHFNKGKNTTKTHTHTHTHTLCSVWRRCCDQLECVKSGLWSSVLEISCWMMLHSWVDQLKLIAIKSRHWEKSTLYHVGDSQHTQTIQINKIIGENQKCVLFYRKKVTCFLTNQKHTISIVCQGQY